MENKNQKESLGEGCHPIYSMGEQELWPLKKKILEHNQLLMFINEIQSQITTRFYFTLRVFNFCFTPWGGKTTCHHHGSVPVHLPSNLFHRRFLGKLWRHECCWPELINNYILPEIDKKAYIKNQSQTFMWLVFQLISGKIIVLSDLAENCYETVEAEGNSSVRGTTKAQSLQQMTQCRRVFAQNIFENELLKFGVVDSNRSSANFEPVEDEVVMKAANLERIGVDELQVVRMRLSEGVMGWL